MKINRIINRMHKAISDFSLIEDGDRIAVGLSGGKDSLTLTAALAAFRKFSEVKFSLIAIAVDAFGNLNRTSLNEFCNKNDVELIIADSQIGDIVFNIRKEKNPCSLCAKMRRGILCQTAKEHGCNKLALGHNANDFTETFFLGISFENRLNTLQPKSFLSETGITVIRPLAYLWEDEISTFAKDFEILKNPCPINHKTQRENIKIILKELDEKIPGFNKKLHESLFHSERYNLIKK